MDYDVNVGESNMLSLWPTHVMRIPIDAPDSWNNELVEIAEDYAKKSMARYQSGFKHAIPNNILLNYKSRAIDELFQIKCIMAIRYLKQAYNLDPQDYTQFKVNMWGNVEGHQDFSMYHAHYGNQLVATYYPRVVVEEGDHPLAGQLTFHNPKALMSGQFARRETPIFPVGNISGMLVIFPGNAPHSTMPMYKQGSYKRALISNIRFTGALEGEASGEVYKSIDDITSIRSQM